jgi:hypothetical protein
MRNLRHGAKSLHHEDETTAKERQPQRLSCDHHGKAARTGSGGGEEVSQVTVIPWCAKGAHGNCQFGQWRVGYNKADSKLKKESPTIE